MNFIDVHGWLAGVRRIDDSWKTTLSNWKRSVKIVNAGMRGGSPVIPVAGPERALRGLLVRCAGAPLQLQAPYSSNMPPC